MGLLDIFRRQPGAAGAATAAGAGEPVEVARSRARRRLIGAVVLLGIGVVAFPLLFETQPRPIPVDIPIEIPSREGNPPLALPPPKVAATKPVVPPATPAPASASAPASAAEPRNEAVRAAAPQAEPPGPAKPQAAAPKPAPEPAKPPVAAKPPTAETVGRFVVQVGAFAEAAAVRDARAKVEKLGLASYTQVVETGSGPRTRVRLGPYGTRDEAEKAAAKLKAAGLPGAVLTL